MIKKEWFLFLLFIVVCNLIACEPSRKPNKTETPETTQLEALNKSNEISPTITPTSSSTPTPVPSKTPTSTATATPLPTFTPTVFPGFPSNFRLYKYWINYEGETVFYFMDSMIDGKIYGKLSDDENDYAITCEPDQSYPKNMYCTSNDSIYSQAILNITFYSDMDHKHIIHTDELNMFIPDHSLFDNCESEYRIYDGVCYQAHTCFDEEGNVVYSFDNIPYGGNFEGFSAPCP